MFKRTIIGAVLCGVVVSIAWAGETYYYVPLSKLTITAGKLPDGQGRDANQPEFNWRRMMAIEGVLQPYAVGQGNTEAYFLTDDNRDSAAWYGFGNVRERISLMRVAMRVTDGKEASGMVFLPKSDWSGMERIGFKATEPAADQKDARTQFLRAKEQYYSRLMESDIPGAAWFRHQRDEATALLKGSTPDVNEVRGANRRLERWEFEEEFSLFSGGRALSENLQLDRRWEVAPSEKMTVDMNSLGGITTAEMDWKAIVKGLAPKKDVLSASIPADQHAIFFPSFTAMTTLTDEAQANGTPILAMFQPRAEDAEVQSRYESQICLSFTELSRLLGPKIVTSVAMTGSDPYLRTGSDVAMLFETVSPDLMIINVKVQQQQALLKVKGAKSVTGKVQGVAYMGAVSPDRALCSYMATIGKMVIVTNSLYQLEQVIKTTKGQLPSIASLDEYTFFRDRYKLGDENESALLVLSDATIRRWCGPKWRIADARRTRAEAIMAELVCRNIDMLAGGKAESKALAMEKPIAGMGELRIGPEGISSSVYGRPGFLTPICEMTVTKATAEEARMYGRFRDSYQRNWRQFFDPIAIRFGVGKGRTAMDMTVRPLIASSEYGDFMSICRNSAITAGAGDPHPESVLHYVMSLDPNSEPVKQFSNFATQMAPGIEANPLNWIGKWASVCVDDDPVWQEIENAGKTHKAQAISQLFEKRLARIPVAIQVDVANPMKLTGFLVALRAFIEQTSPGMTMWETRTYKERAYVKVSPSAEAKESMPPDVNGLAIYYAVSPKSLFVTINEPMIKRFIDRAIAKAAGKSETAAGARPWLGKSVAVQAKQRAMTVVQSLFREDMDTRMQRAAWGNIPILNEWHRRYAKASPVELHKRLWHMKLLCPGGGEYVWNEEYRTMESTVYGHPGQPKANSRLSNALLDITSLDMGLTFEGNGLRAAAEVTRKTK